MRLKTLLIAGLLVAASLAPVTAAKETLTGTFTSGFQDGPEAIRAVFTPTEDGAFEVSFFFKFNGRSHEYVGTAQGTLGEGSLSGEVRSDGGRKRTFTFEGEFNDKGVFKGTHAEKTRGGSRKTGTISLEG